MIHQGRIFFELGNPEAPGDLVLRPKNLEFPGGHPTLNHHETLFISRCKPDATKIAKLTWKNREINVKNRGRFRSARPKHRAFPARQARETRDALRFSRAGKNGPRFAGQCRAPSTVQPSSGLEFLEAYQRNGKCEITNDHCPAVVPFQDHCWTVLGAQHCPAELLD